MSNKFALLDIINQLFVYRKIYVFFATMDSKSISRREDIYEHKGGSIMDEALASVGLLHHNDVHN